MPVFLHKPRFRRSADAPHIETKEWVRAMSRRCEASVSQDYSFGFVSWNYQFRSELNLSRSLCAYERKNGVATGAQFTPESLEAGAIEITEKLWGWYKDGNENWQKVNGDIAKVGYVPDLSEEARVLLKNIGYTSRKLPGTIEARRMMRFITQAYRIKYGTAVFVTFSPDEKHNLLMVRLSRTRQEDPVWQNSDLKSQRGFSRKDEPSLDKDTARCKFGTSTKADGDDEEVSFAVSSEDLTGFLPTFDQRRRILATDALASVEGFRVMVELTMQYLFGVNYCPMCPNCATRGNPCQDLFGSSAKAEGGIFGRVDAVFVSIEAQKSTGSLHAHCQVFVQCLHQHTPLWEIMDKMKMDCGRVIVDGYLEYKAHVCRQVYESERDVVDERLYVCEEQWPDYKESLHLISSPEYLRAEPYDLTTAQPTEELPRIAEEGEAWLRKHLGDDVEELQMMRQHHVHLVNPATGKREPLAACKSKENPNLCKCHFPRNKWLVREPVVLCRGLLKQMGLHTSGRRNQLGGLLGPMCQECLNATHSAILAVHRNNSDVQLPYRLLVIEGVTHFL